jgi:23S rRNA pseudouridine1911/1915/1917 synthase
MKISLKTGATDVGVRADVFLSKAVPLLSRSKAATLLHSGAIQLDGERCKPSHRLRGGETLEGELPLPPPPTVEPEDIPLGIVHEDEDIAVVNKPAGMVVHPAGSLRSGTMVNALLFHLNKLSHIGGRCRPGLVHRLDKGTSGLLVVAKSDMAHHRLSLQVLSREMDRRYLAYIWGVPGIMSGTIRKPLARSRRDRRRFVPDPAGKHAVTHFRRLESYRLATKLEITLETGRTHQIRVHMSYAGHPVVGDATYGGRQRAVGRLPSAQKPEGRLLLRIIARQALHAYRLVFDHPRTGERLSFQAAPPGDMIALQETLRERWGTEELE